MRVRDIMGRDVVTIAAENTFGQAAQILRDHGISAGIVVDDGRPTGIVTERDYVNLVADGHDPTGVLVGDRMTTDLYTVESRADVTEAAQLMTDHHIRHIPVVDQGRLVGIVSMRDPITGHPALRKVDEERRKSLQSRVADRVTTFAGSMPFVYIHAVWFTLWIAFGVEKFPFGLLTMIVSLEAIFLSTFVMISQNRADEKRQALADHQWELVQYEEKQNEELIQLSEQILTLTGAIHDLTLATTGAPKSTPIGT